MEVRMIKKHMFRMKMADNEEKCKKYIFHGVSVFLNSNF